MKKFLALISFIISFNSFSQEMGQSSMEKNSKAQINQNQRTILDDSSKVIYSLKTTKYLLKEKFNDGDTILISPDTLLTNFEKVYG